MFFDEPTSIPSCLKAMEIATEKSQFTMPSDRFTGSLLRFLAASKPCGRILELGTGTGLSACWMLDGMDANSKLITVDIDPEVVAIAQKHLIDERIEFRIQDGMDFLASLEGESFDLIFADAMPGKYEGLSMAISLLADGGIYVIDDMLPQPNWPENHQSRVDALLENLLCDDRLLVTTLKWSTGIAMATKITNSKAFR